MENNFGSWHVECQLLCLIIFVTCQDYHNHLCTEVGGDGNNPVLRLQNHLSLTVQNSQSSVLSVINITLGRRCEEGRKQSKLIVIVWKC